MINRNKHNFLGRKEVKVMSDLAMISAGENAMEVDKVSCFLSAVMGFAPFLFDLHEKNADLDALVKAFKQISKEDQARLKERWVSCTKNKVLTEILLE